MAERYHQLAAKDVEVAVAAMLDAIATSLVQGVGVELRGFGILGVSVSRFFVQQMKTKWGSCNPHARTIRLNTELAKKPKECLEYIVLHEMVHLLEPTHNARFVALMDRFMPKWQLCLQGLNRLPVRHADWGY